MYVNTRVGGGGVKLPHLNFFKKKSYGPNVLHESSHTCVLSKSIWIDCYVCKVLLTSALLSAKSAKLAQNTMLTCMINKNWTDYGSRMIHPWDCSWQPSMFCCPIWCHLCLRQHYFSHFELKKILKIHHVTSHDVITSDFHQAFGKCFTTLYLTCVKV